MRYLNVFLLFISCMLLIACSSGKQGDKYARNNDHPRGLETRSDLKKAALLNIELGHGYLKQGHITRAKKKFIHAVNMAPELAEVHTAIGYFWETVGDIKEAEAAYRKAVSLGNGRGSFYNNYGTFLCREGRYKQAENIFLKSMKDKQYSNSAEVYENAGLCSLRAIEADKAEHYLSLAVRHDPRRIRSLLELSEIKFNKENYKGAQGYLQRFLDQTEPTARSLWLGIQIATKLDNKDAIASNVLLLKNRFEKSHEYQLYLESKENG
jgi:type IV pilus assembly protein PilF